MKKAFLLVLPLLVLSCSPLIKNSAALNIKGESFLSRLSVDEKISEDDILTLEIRMEYVGETQNDGQAKFEKQTATGTISELKEKTFVFSKIEFGNTVVFLCNVLKGEKLIYTGRSEEITVTKEIQNVEIKMSFIAEPEEPQESQEQEETQDQEESQEQEDEGESGQEIILKSGDSLNNCNLEGKTVIILGSNIELSAVTNGNILIKDEGGENIKLSNCNISDFTVESSSNLNLFNTTIANLTADNNLKIIERETSSIIEKLTINGNANVSASGCTYKKVEKSKGCGGDFIFISGSSSETKVEETIEYDSSGNELKLELLPVYEVAGKPIDGVQINMKGQSAERDTIIINLVNENGNWLQIFWGQIYPYDASIVLDDSYYYPFSTSGKNYKLVITYFKEKGSILLNSNIVDISTTRGDEFLAVSNQTKSARLIADEKTGDIYWEKEPVINEYDNSKIVFELHSPREGETAHYITAISFPSSWEKKFQTLNVYDLFAGLDETIINNIYNNKVFVAANYDMKGIHCPIGIRTELFEYNVALAEEHIPIDYTLGGNVITITKKPNKNIIDIWKLYGKDVSLNWMLTFSDGTSQWLGKADLNDKFEIDEISFLFNTENIDKITKDKKCGVEFYLWDNSKDISEGWICSVSKKEFVYDYPVEAIDFSVESNSIVITRTPDEKIVNIWETLGKDVELTWMMTFSDGTNQWLGKVSLNEISTLPLLSDITSEIDKNKDKITAGGNEYGIEFYLWDSSKDISEGWINSVAKKKFTYTP